MTDFFISYTQADRTWAEWIAGVLEAAGYEVRLQAWDFRPGKNFVAELHRIVDEAERTLVVLSPDYLTSQFGLAEWTAAFRQDPTGAFGKLLPIKVREVDPGGLLRSLTYIDLVGLEATAARERLMAGLSRGRAKPGVLPEFPGGASPVPDAATAVSWLSSLPTEEVPAPRHLPAGSRMPFSRNPFFVGRQDDLRTLARHLKHGETFAVGQVEIAATTGLGGIGKTQLACEFVHRYGGYFAGGVFWMSFADPNGVPAEVAACGRGLNLHPTYESLPLDEQISLVEQAWQRPLPRLLVFDNCEDEELLDRWRPPYGGSAVLVTSRRARWEPTLVVRTIPLGTLPRAASLDLLHKFRPDVPLDDPAMDAIADELGDLPLALHLAGSFLFHYADSPTGEPAAYLDSLRRDDLLGHPSLQGLITRVLPTRHEVHVGRTFALSIERLKPEDSTDALALVLLARAACFAPGEPIPRSLLLKTVDFAEEDQEAPIRAEDALGRLTALGLLEQGETGTLVIHRLVAEFAGAFEQEEEARGAVERSLLAAANRLNWVGYPAPLVVWHSHLRAVVEEARQREDERAAWLCNALGYHLTTIGDYWGARPYFERALVIFERVLGLEHPETALSLNNIGCLLDNQGDLAGARPFFERALAINEKIFGAEHSLTSLSLNNLGCLLDSQGNMAGAKPFHERALAIREKVLGSEHPETALALNNLGVLLANQGDLAGARSYFERVLTIREKVLGAEHPDTAVSLNNLGVLLSDQGEIDGARLYYERALMIREKALGVEHPDTAKSLNNLGVLLWTKCDFAGARQCYERALAIVERGLDSEHPDTALSLNNLGALLESQGEFAGARTYYERALAIREKVLGLEHPETAISLNNLGAHLRNQGNFGGARQYYERALAIFETVLGAEHAETATSLNNLGALLYYQGDFSGARPYYERALAIREKMLGSEHPHTAISLSNLGSILQRQCDLARAKPYFERALAIREKVLGPAHPDTATSLNNLGALLADQGDLAGAEPYFERALAIVEKVLGPEHPDTACSLNNLGFLLDGQGDLAGARPYYERALAIRGKVLGPEHPDTANSLSNLGVLLSIQGDLSGARQYCERALAIFEFCLGPNHPNTETARANLAALGPPPDHEAGD